MRRVTGLVAVLLLLMSWVTMPLPTLAVIKVAVIEVKGMVCRAGPFSVKTALERLQGVKRAEVSLERAEARIQFDDAKIGPDKLAAAIDQLGFRARVVGVEPGG